MYLANKENIFFLIFSFLPISIILGSTISLVNIIIINLIFLGVLIHQKNFGFINHIAVKLLFILYLYLIFNSLISQNYEIGLARNIGFIRIIILFIFINYFFFYLNNEKKLFDFWTIILSILIFDIFIEYFFDTNLLGWGASVVDGVPQPDGNRITSFFIDEPVAGSFLLAFIFLVFGHNFKKKNKKFFVIIFFLLAFIALILTGERSNTIKIFLGITIFFLFVDFIKIKTKIIIFLMLSVTFGTIITKSEYIKLRYVGQLFNLINSKENAQKFWKENLYFRLHRSGFEVFKNYPIFGVGNKNYRVEACKKYTTLSDNEKKYYLCQTHPHQIYFELLSEHGLFGTIIILGILFYLMFNILKSILISRNYVQIGTFIFVLINFIPILPSGSFFSDFNSVLFWINFSIMFGCNKATNIFAKRSN
tara:strand:+ start:1414 stop:2679 length:1266 start_codon:yes stop_codon:yes gene_type:complete